MLLHAYGTPKPPNQNWEGYFIMTHIDSRGHNPALLSLRGGAALAVLLFHALLTFQVHSRDVRWFVLPAFDNASVFINESLVLLFNGGAAVTFFFVHSGFVLALSLYSHFQKMGTHHPLILCFSFYLRRIFRLFPVIIVSVGCYAIFQYYFWHPLESPPASSWVNGLLKSSISSGNVISNILLLKHDIVKFSWSLQVEWQLSVMMPLIFFVITRDKWLLAIALLLYMLAYMDNPSPRLTHSYIESWFYCFLMGALSTTMPSRFKGMLPSSEKKVIFIFMGCLLVLIWARILIKPIQAAVVLEGVAAAILVFITYYCCPDIINKLCTKRVALYFGRISYSLYMFSGLSIYLAAMIVLWLFGPSVLRMDGLLLNLCVALASVLIVVPLSHLSYKIVEAPFQDIGKKLSSYIETRSVSATRNLS